MVGIVEPLKGGQGDDGSSERIIDKLLSIAGIFFCVTKSGFIENFSWRQARRAGTGAIVAALSPNNKFFRSQGGIL